ncbi:MAG: gliding motility-associated C-terminal domain-containing protein [Bacteroidales bacterium]|jgi:gliding motility-associated-like protein|nr:gliding motility-associated C-terminal domain-containing protein [Bacteroidales bacterium]MDD3702488.1 gliding motility-associated C-terminal domain-containing protein [Bacteroidales bacterium]MDY0368461.1 gliding motility-associated C-terminal domain-containing protein [Bacteroidales bacterium]
MNLKSLFSLLLMLLSAFLIHAANPPAPQITRISFNPDTNEEITIEWAQGEGDYTIIGFNVYLWKEEGGLTKIDSIMNPDSRTYTFVTYTQEPMENYIFQLSLRYTDTFGIEGESAMSDDLLQSIIIHAENDPCTQRTTLFFREYMIDAQAPEYIIYFKTEGDLWLEIARVPSDQLSIRERILTSRPGPEGHFNRNVYEYTHYNILTSRTDIYYVVAHFPEEELPDASSNSFEVQTSIYSPPLLPSIQSVTVETTNEVRIYYEAPEAERSEAMFLVRRTIDPPSTDTLFIPSLSNGELVFVDTEHVATDKYRYRYQIGHIDSCHFVSVSEPEHPTILLRYELTSESRLRFYWNEYEAWPIESQILTNQGKPFKSFFAGDFSFETELEELLLQETPLSLQLNVNGYEPHQQSASNILYLDLEIDPVMPNAFNPHSQIIQNRSFKPVQLLHSTQYHLKIYNRWGALIWESKNPLEGWDGTNQEGKLYPADTYVYQLQFIGKGGTVQQKNGSVSLVY